MIDMSAYKIDAVGPPWRYVLRKYGEPVFTSPAVCMTRGDAVRCGIIDKPRLVASLEHQQESLRPKSGEQKSNFDVS
jgi:hypothetical protein